jgi:multidrug efflux pump subunit AcrA (membrane-fusion protein)
VTHRITVGFLIAAFNIATVSCGKSPQANSQNETDSRTVRGKTEIIQLSTVADFFQAPGTIRARTATVVSSKIAGQILSLSVREGERVHEGQVIAKIENREAGAQLRRAQAGVVEAQHALEEADRSIRAADAAVRAAEANRDLAFSTRQRYALLRERRSVSSQEYDEIETKCRAAQLDVERATQALAAANARRQQISARIQQAEAEVEAAEVARGYSRIVSPIDGIVTARQADPGALAMPGMPLLAIEDDRTYELEVSLEDSRAAKVRIGQSAQVEVDALDGVTLKGRIREIIPSSDPATRTYTAKLQLTTSLPATFVLRSGFFGRAIFPAGERQALVVPETALTRRGQLEGIYIVENDIAMRRLVKTGKRYGSGVEIISGLSPGTRILPAPPAEVSDGTKILDEESLRNTP